jgi:hypothetical protein
LGSCAALTGLGAAVFEGEPPAPPSDAGFTGGNGAEAGSDV